jgi:hypothetical protein
MKVALLVIAGAVGAYAAYKMLTAHADEKHPEHPELHPGPAPPEVLADDGEDD